MAASFGIINYNKHNRSVPCLCVPKENGRHGHYPNQYNLFAGGFESRDGSIRLPSGRLVRNAKNTAKRECKEEGFPMTRVTGDFRYVGSVGRTPIYAFRIKNGTSRKHFAPNSETVSMDYFPIANYRCVRTDASGRTFVANIDGKYKRVSSFHLQVVRFFV